MDVSPTHVRRNWTISTKRSPKKLFSSFNNVYIKCWVLFSINNFCQLIVNEISTSKRFVRPTRPQWGDCCIFHSNTFVNALSLSHLRYIILFISMSNEHWYNKHWGYICRAITNVVYLFVWCHLLLYLIFLEIILFAWKNFDIYHSGR